MNDALARHNAAKKLLMSHPGWTGQQAREELARHGGLVRYQKKSDGYDSAEYAGPGDDRELVEGMIQAVRDAMLEFSDTLSPHCRAMIEALADVIDRTEDELGLNVPPVPVTGRKATY
jgi:hypothetical protein